VEEEIEKRTEVAFLLYSWECSAGGKATGADLYG